MCELATRPYGDYLTSPGIDDLKSNSGAASGTCTSLDTTLPADTIPEDSGLQAIHISLTSILKAAQRSIGTQFRLQLAQTPLAVARRPRIVSSAPVNGQYDEILGDVLVPVPVRAFAVFISQHADVRPDLRLVPMADSAPLGLDAGFVLGAEADVRLAAYQTIFLPVWSLVKRLSWPTAGQLLELCWLNERGTQGWSSNAEVCQAANSNHTFRAR